MPLGICAWAASSQNSFHRKTPYLQLSDDAGKSKQVDFSDNTEHFNCSANSKLKYNAFQSVRYADARQPPEAQPAPARRARDTGKPEAAELQRVQWPVSLRPPSITAASCAATALKAIAAAALHTNRVSGNASRPTRCVSCIPIPSSWASCGICCNEQTALTLVRLYPNGHEHRVSHKTICNCIYAQPVGELREELIACLRHAHSKGQDRLGQAPDMPSSIHVRPARD